MDTGLMIKRIELLCAQRSISKKTAFVESGVGKNFEYNLKTSNASKKNLQILAQYFDVPVEYLTGEIGEEELEAQNTTEVIEWLEDNGFEYSTDDYDRVIIGKNGKYNYYSSGEFDSLCHQIKEESRDGFEFVMRDHFSSFSTSSVTDCDYPVSGETNMLFENIVKAAERANITISAIEKACGFGNGTIGKWKTSIPKVDKLHKVAQLLGKPIEYFLTGEDTVTHNNNNILTNSINESANSVLFVSEKGNGLSKQEIELVATYRKMNIKQQMKMINYLIELSEEE